MLITSARWLSTTNWIAFIIAGRPWTPSVSAVGVVTRSMFARGAVAWAHWTSSETSRAQRVWFSWAVPLLGGGGGGGGEPSTVGMWRVARATVHTIPSWAH